MPHLPFEEKEQLLDHPYPKNAGQLTYLITVSALRFWSQSNRRFESLCIIMGAFICAAFEFYRQVVSKYEDKKITENGSAYTGVEI